MDYIFNYLNKFLPVEICRKIFDYEWSDKKWHTKLELDNFTIGNKFTLSRQISKAKRDIVILDHSITWNKIIIFKKQFK